MANLRDPRAVHILPEAVEYKSACHVTVATIPAGTKCRLATNLPAEDGLRYWALPWEGMTERERSWHRNYGFLLTVEDIRGSDAPPLFIVDGEVVGEMRRATVKGGLNVTLELVQDYLPSNYQAVEGPDGIVIEGADNAGWTLEEYVIPRLASGLIFAEVIMNDDGDSENS